VKRLARAVARDSLRTKVDDGFVMESSGALARSAMTCVGKEKVRRGDNTGEDGGDGTHLPDVERGGDFGLPPIGTPALNPRGRASGQRHPRQPIGARRGVTLPLTGRPHKSAIKEFPKKPQNKP
jgi:hypothetical protein